METFNYRVLAETEFAGTEYENDVLSIHRIYYKDGKAVAYGDSPVIVMGDDVEELRRVLEKMKLALEKDILWGGDRFPEVYKEV